MKRSETQTIKEYTTTVTKVYYDNCDTEIKRTRHCLLLIVKYAMLIYVT